MAVPAYLREESKADFVTVAVRLAAWTLKWCKDERLFTRRERWIITGDLWDEAKRVVLCVKMANGRKNLANRDDYEARTAYLKRALDALNAMEMLLTIKYEMVLRGFNATKQAQPDAATEPVAKENQTADGQQPSKKTKRGGRKRLTQDDVDRIFEIFFDMTDKERGLINGLLPSDAERHAAANRSK